MPGTASDIVIMYDGQDITNYVLFSSARFEGQVAAVAGTFEITVKDENRTLEFVSGRELTLDLDGVRLFGGHVFTVSRGYAVPADRTDVLSEVRSRRWVLRGSDYNFVLDKRVLRNPSAYTQQIPRYSSGGVYDGAVIRNKFSDYFDMPSGWDMTSTARIKDTHNFPKGYTWPTQGTTMRDVLVDLGRYGSVFYMDGSKQLHFKNVEDTAAPWGFSDVPNGTTRIGFRDGEYTEDGTAIVNDALVWGGSEWSGDGDVVFARRQNSTSQSEHGRWQLAEVNVGNENYKSQAEVNARANVIVDGNESGTFAEGSKGLVNPERQFKATWFGKDVPSNVHLKPGDVTPIDLWVFSEDGGTTPFTVNLPLRQITITFPTLTSDGLTHVKFDGFFGIQNSDPYWLWHYVRSLKPGTSMLTTADDTSDSPPYGSLYSGIPTPDTNGSETVFNVPFPYISRSLSVYKDGLLQIRGTHYSESDPATGEFTMFSAPSGSSVLYCQCYTA